MCADVFSVSGYRLDTPSNKKDKGFINTFDGKLRDAVLFMKSSMQVDRMSKILDEDYVQHIRKLHGTEQKISTACFTYCKSALDAVLGGLRVYSGLIKSCKAYQAKMDANQVKPCDRSALQQAFTAFRACKLSTVSQELPWCVCVLEILASFDVSGSTQHPADVINKSATMKRADCKVSDWTELVEDLVYSRLECILSNKPGSAEINLRDLKAATQTYNKLATRITSRVFQIVLAVMGSDLRCQITLIEIFSK